MSQEVEKHYWNDGGGCEPYVLYSAYAKLRADNKVLLEALKAAEKYEAALILEWADFWDVAPQPLIDALMHAQTLRNTALAKAERP